MVTDRRSVTSEDLNQQVLAKIKQYEDTGFPEAGEIHKLIMTANPSLSPRLWYGMPGYAKTKDSAVLCFFRKDTLISFGISESANIDQLGEGKSTTASAWYITTLDQDAQDVITRIVSEVTQ